MMEQEFESILEAYPVRLQNFEGPLDLLLHLIKRSEVNIYDIPITRISFSRIISSSARNVTTRPARV